MSGLTMMKKTIQAILIIGTIAFVGIGEAFGQKQAFRRFAVIVGANYGGPGRIQLKYAISDANSVAKALWELGGLASDDTYLLYNPSIETIKARLQLLANKVNESKDKYSRTELIFYYSGHSDEEGLLLSGEKLNYSQLRKMVGDVPADVKIAVLDSCSSGAMTRTKGGKMTSPFLMDTSVSMKGYAFLTSSSEEEASQESDIIGGSFFTHYLVSALRGAADANRDGKVTLNETYQYTFDETLARTQNTISGPQHPGIDIQMTGSGDVVISDIRSTSAGIEFTTEIGGRLFIRDKSGKLVAELDKAQGNPISVGLASGDYTISLDDNNQIYTCSVNVPATSKPVINRMNFSQASKEYTVARGGIEGKSLNNLFDNLGNSVISMFNVESNSHYQYAPIDLSFGGPGDARGKAYNNIYLNISGKGGKLLGAGFALVGREQTDLTIGYLYGTIYTKGGTMTIGLQQAAIFNDCAGDMLGVQTAGVFNSMMGSGAGVQTAGVFCTTKGSFYGVQAAGVFNETGSKFMGVQTAGVFNKVGSTMFGVQAAGVFNDSGQMVGVQAAGIWNITGEGLGIQTAGIFNRSRDFTGLQIAGIYNMVIGNMYGLQVGTVNMVGDIQGGQVGVVNLAAGTVTGFQIGVVNICDDINGIPIGVFSYVKKGYNKTQLWYDETGFYHLGFTFGTRYIYSIANIGVNEKFNRGSLGAGLGLHIPVGWFFANMDGTLEKLIPFDQQYQFSWTELFSQKNMDTLLRFRLIAGVDLFGFGVFAGLTYTVQLPSQVWNPSSAIDSTIQPVTKFSQNWIDANIKSWPGFIFGIQF